MIIEFNGREYEIDKEVLELYSTYYGNVLDKIKRKNAPEFLFRDLNFLESITRILKRDSF